MLSELNIVSRIRYQYQEHKAHRIVKEMIVWETRQHLREILNLVIQLIQGSKLRPS
jgi:hypothetical protein